MKQSLRVPDNHLNQPPPSQPMEEPSFLNHSSYYTQDFSSTLSRCPSSILASPRSTTSRTTNSNKSKKADKPSLTGRPHTNGLSTLDTNLPPRSPQYRHPFVKKNQNVTSKKEGSLDVKGLVEQNRRLLERQSELEQENKRLVGENSKLRVKWEAFSQIKDRIQTLEDLNHSLEQKLGLYNAPTSP